MYKASCLVRCLLVDCCTSVLGNKTCLVLHDGSPYGAIMCGGREKKTLLVSITAHALPTRTAQISSGDLWSYWSTGEG